MGGTSTLAKSFCLLAAWALFDRQRFHFGRGVEGGSLLAMTLSNYEFNHAKLTFYACVRMRAVNYAGALCLLCTCYSAMPNGSCNQWTLNFEPRWEITNMNLSNAPYWRWARHKWYAVAVLCPHNLYQSWQGKTVVLLSDKLLLYAYRCILTLADSITLLPPCDHGGLKVTPIRS